MQLTIEQLKPGEKSTGVKVGNTWYRIRNANGAGRLAKGMTIDATVKDSDYNGETFHWIESFTTETAQAQTQPVAGPKEDRWYMPFVSNICAHAISAGLIKEPTDIKKWAMAAYDAASNADDVPF